MQRFLGISIFGFCAGYLLLYAELVKRLPASMLDNLLPPFLPVVAFTLIVLIALAYFNAKLDRIERLLGQLDR